MAHDENNSRPAVTPRQLAVIGVLAAILAGVLFVQFGGEGEPEPADQDRPAGGAGSQPAAQGPARRGTGHQPAAQGPTSPAAAAGDASPRPAWPRLSLSEAAAYDPFTVPDVFARTASATRKKAAAAGSREAQSRRKAEQERALAALRSAGASAVFRSPQGSVAIVGRNVVRVGDEVNGFRVVSIDDDGVLLAPPNPQDGQEDQP